MVNCQKIKSKLNLKIGYRIKLIAFPNDKEHAIKSLKNEIKICLFQKLEGIGWNIDKGFIDIRAYEFAELELKYKFISDVLDSCSIANKKHNLTKFEKTNSKELKDYELQKTEEQYLISKKEIWAIRDLIHYFGEWHPSVKGTKKGHEIALLGSYLPDLVEKREMTTHKKQKVQEIYKKYNWFEKNNIKTISLDSLIDLVEFIMNDCSPQKV